MGWNAQRTFPLLPVAGEIVLLTFPFIALATPCGVVVWDSNSIGNMRYSTAYDQPTISGR